MSLTVNVCTCTSNRSLRVHLYAFSFLLQLSESEQEDLLFRRSGLLKRATTVDVTLLTPRTEQQVEALRVVTEVVDKLLTSFHDDTTRELCEMYLNACLSEATGPIDHKFQSKVKSLVYIKARS